MEISKLTIRPIIRGAQKIDINNPSSERAKRLIIDKLSLDYETVKLPKSKLPKALRGFVNPETRVVKYLNKFV